MDDRKMTQADIKIVFETAKTLLELSYKLRDADILPEIGKKITMLADETLKVVEDENKEPEELFLKINAEYAMPEMPKQDGLCNPGECQCCDDERNKCHGHSEAPTITPENPEMACNGHNAMGPDAGEMNVMDFPTGNSSPDIDNEINSLLNKVRGQIDAK